MAYIFYFDYKTKSFLSKKGIETLLVNFSFFFPPPNSCNAKPQFLAPAAWPRARPKGARGIFAWLSSRAGHECHLEPAKGDGNGSYFAQRIGFRKE